MLGDLGCKAKEQEMANMKNGGRQSLEALASCPFLDTEAAAAYLHLSPQTLEKYRVIGGSPRFRKHGRKVVYAIKDLAAWSEARARTSTSDSGEAA